MTPRALRAERLRSHRLTAPATSMTDAARHMLAVQSQDLLAGRWALGVRTRASARSGPPRLRDADAAFGRGELVRAWTMRGTLHIVPAEDLRWVLSVTAERQLAQAAPRHRALGIDDHVVAAAWRALRPAVSDGGATRAEAFELLRRAGIETGRQRGVHLLFALTVRGHLCQGPVVASTGVSREQRFVAVDDWVRVSAMPADPLAELFVRYIDGHGPAGTADFAWWSGVTLGIARDAAERARGRVREVEGGLFTGLVRPRRSARSERAFALPAFDEYYISYADRTLVCPAEHLAAVGPGKNGMVRATVVEDGAVVGTWSHADAARGSAAAMFDADRDPAAATAALDRFARFVEA